MTKQAQNAAIASWMGQSADYVGDLNAMHEAERKLSAVESRDYNQTLCHICIPLRALFPPFAEPCCDRYLFHATAAQRAEALLRTLNLWRDDPATPQPTAPHGAQPTGAVDAAPTKGT